MEPRLLKPKKVMIRNYRLLTWDEVRKIISAHKKTKLGIQEAAYEVNEVTEPEGTSFYNVRMEYLIK